MVVENTVVVGFVSQEFVVYGLCSSSQQAAFALQAPQALVSAI
jgi:hypothetical protein